MTSCDRRQWAALLAGLWLGAGPLRAAAQASPFQAPSPAPRVSRISSTRLVIAIEQRSALAYLPLTVGQWWNSATDWTDPGADGLFHNTPGITHSMRALPGKPFLALWFLPV